jgi:hypothetical protein
MMPDERGTGPRQAISATPKGYHGREKSLRNFGHAGLHFLQADFGHNGGILLPIGLVEQFE